MIRWQWLTLFAFAFILVAASELWRQRYFRELSLAELAATMPRVDGAKHRGIYEFPYSQEIRSRFHLKRTVFLVRGDNLNAAIKSTYRHAIDGEPVDAIIEPNDGKNHKEAWLAFHMGKSGSDPPRWQIRNIRFEGSTLCVYILEDNSGFRTCDMHAYWGWLPLGELPPGTYPLALINKTTGDRLDQSVVIP